MFSNKCTYAKGETEFFFTVNNVLIIGTNFFEKCLMKLITKHYTCKYSLIVVVIYL